VCLCVCLGVLFWLLSFFAVSIPFFFLYFEPDFGSLTLLFFLLLALVFVLGVPWFYFFAGFGLFATSFIFFATSEKYRLSRLEAFINPWEDPSGKGFQVIQSLLGVHSGSLWGTGLGKGQSKLFFLPEAHTDFTLAVFAEETGFIGLTILFSVYAFLIHQGWKVSLKAYDFYEKIIAFCLVFVFALSVFTHCAVNLAMLPTKGLTLPFLSYGGSSLVCVFLLFGWLLSIERNNRS